MFLLKRNSPKWTKCDIRTDKNWKLATHQIIYIIKEGNETKKTNEADAKDDYWETNHAASFLCGGWKSSKERWSWGVLMKPSRDIWKEHLLFSSYESWDSMRRRWCRSETCCIRSCGRPGKSSFDGWKAAARKSWHVRPPVGTTRTLPQSHHPLSHEPRVSEEKQQMFSCSLTTVCPTGHKCSKLREWKWYLIFILRLVNIVLWYEKHNFLILLLPVLWMSINCGNNIHRPLKRERNATKIVIVQLFFIFTTCDFCSKLVYCHIVIQVRLPQK